MNINNANEIIEYYIKLFNNSLVYNLFKNIDNVLILSSDNNQYVSKFLAFVLNHKYNCVSTSEVLSNINDSKLKVYNNIVIIDSKTEAYLKSKKINAKIYNISHLIQNHITEFERKEPVLTFVIISLSLVVYYNERVLDVFKMINGKINNVDVQSIKNYDAIVCNELMNIGLKVFNSNIKSMSYISFIDQNNYNSNIILLGQFSEEEIQEINSIVSNSTLKICDFNDDIEQFIYGMLLGIKIGG